MLMSKSKIIKMQDAATNYRIRKEGSFDLPLRLIIVGKSQQSGKSNLIGNLLLRPINESDVDGRLFYRNEFQQIYVVNPSIDIDTKWGAIVDGREIPEQNIYRRYDEEELEELYNRIEKQFNEHVADGKKPPHVLLILDDCAFSGALKEKMAGVLAKIACQGRHILLSMIVTAQKYSQIHTVIRENCTAAIFFEGTNKQTDLIYEDFGTMPRKEFDHMFREATKERHSFMIVNFSNSSSERFQNCAFEPIKLN